MLQVEIQLNSLGTEIIKTIHNKNENLCLLYNTQKETEYFIQGFNNSIYNEEIIQTNKQYFITKIISLNNNISKINIDLLDNKQLIQLEKLNNKIKILLNKIS